MNLTDGYVCNSDSRKTDILTNWEDKNILSILRGVSCFYNITVYIIKTSYIIMIIIISVKNRFSLGVFEFSFSGRCNRRRYLIECNA